MDDPKEAFKFIYYSVLGTIVYLGGVAIIDLGIRPLFEPDGLSLFVEFILLIGDFSLAAFLLYQLFHLLKLLRRSAGELFAVKDRTPIENPPALQDANGAEIRIQDVIENDIPAEQPVRRRWMRRRP